MVFFWITGTLYIAVIQCFGSIWKEKNTTKANTTKLLVAN
jgi:hypothetical protein